MIANINDRGAWIYIVWNGRIAGVGFETYHRAFATVDGAKTWLHEKLVVSGEVTAKEFEEWVGCLTSNPPGTVDCYHSAWPVVWYDPSRDDGNFEIEDHDEFEEALSSRSLTFEEWRALSGQTQSQK